MKGLPRQTQGIIAAGLVAILTISVFAVSQFGGPESAIRLYHFGVATREPDTVKSVTLQSPESGSARQLQALVEAVLANGARIEGLTVVKQGRDATVEVAYRFDGGVSSLQFYMVKPRGRWMVDADRTWSLATRAPYLGS